MSVPVAGIMGQPAAFAAPGQHGSAGHARCDALQPCEQPLIGAQHGATTIVGFGTSSVIPITYSAAGRSATLSPGVALALVSTIGFFGFLAGPPLIGFLAEWSSLRLSFVFVALVGAGIGLLAGYALAAG